MGGEACCEAPPGRAAAVKRVRRTSPSLVFVVVLMLFAAVAVDTARAQDVNVRAELEAIDLLLQRAMRAYRLAHYEEAYRLARSAYLDHFEAVEIPLRAVDPDLTLDLEYGFAELRNQMRVGAPAREVEAAADGVRRGLDEVESLFSDTGFLAPSFVFGAAWMILLREGLEAVLVLAALLGYLQSVPGGLLHRRAVLEGALAAVGATALVWALVRTVFILAPVARDLLEAGVAFVAVGVLVWTTFWLSARYDHRRWMEFLQAKAWAAMSGGHRWALTGLGFTAVFREGLETILFYEVLLGLGRTTQAFVWYGLAAGFVVLGVVAWLILQSGRRLPIQTFLKAAVALVAVLSVFIAGKGVRDLQEAGLVDVTIVGTLPRLPRPIAEFTGVHPTLQTLTAQAAIAGVYAVGWLAGRWRSGREPLKAASERGAQ